MKMLSNHLTGIWRWVLGLIAAAFLLVSPALAGQDVIALSAYAKAPVGKILFLRHALAPGVAPLAPPLVRPGGHLALWHEEGAEVPEQIARFRDPRVLPYQLPEPAARARQLAVWNRF